MSETNMYHIFYSNALGERYSLMVGTSVRTLRNYDENIKSGGELEYKFYEDFSSDEQQFIDEEVFGIFLENDPYFG